MTQHTAWGHLLKHFDMLAVATENDIKIDFWIVQSQKQHTKQSIIFKFFQSWLLVKPNLDNNQKGRKKAFVDLLIQCPQVNQRNENEFNFALGYDWMLPSCYI